QSALDGVPVGEVQRAGQVRVVGIRTGRGSQVLWLPPVGRTLSRTDTILFVRNRDGLGDIMHRAMAPEAVEI
ncbi:MAG TPA: hypothetical protein VGJ28_01365, partial [Micromonosporaceae bacterium]